LGKACAERFAKDGGIVYVFDLNAKTGAETEKELCRFGEAHFIPCDVTDEGSVKAAFERVIAEKGRVDILHSNAGVIDKPMTIAEMSFERWQRIININLNGMFLSAKYAIQQMLKQPGGVIVFTGSNWNNVCDPGFTSYAASKGGVVSFARALALDHAKDNIRINVVCPGNMLTPLLERQLSEEADPVATLKAMGQISRPEEIANLVTFLASDEASAMKGSAVIIDQGETLGYGKGLAAEK
jgi:NAD(P)-dependent dehydrogenase (short-subunit alcohol dehydrogenase family)